MSQRRTPEVAMMNEVQQPTRSPLEGEPEPDRVLVGGGV